MTGSRVQLHVLTYFPIKRLVPKIKVWIKLTLEQLEPRRIRGWAIFYTYRFTNSLDNISEFRWVLKVSENKKKRKTFLTLLVINLIGHIKLTSSDLITNSLLFQSRFY